MLTDEEVKHIASLARIKLEPNDAERFKANLSSILDYIDTLKKVNTDSVEPLYQVTGLINAVRPDESRDAFPISAKLNKLLIGQAPLKKDRFLKVKSVLKK